MSADMVPGMQVSNRSSDLNIRQNTPPNPLQPLAINISIRTELEVLRPALV